MKNSKRGILSFILLFAVIVGGYLWWQQRTKDQPAAPQPVLASVAAPAAPEPSPAPVEPAIQHPIEIIADTQPLPELNESDSVWGQAFAALIGKKAWRTYFLSDSLIRRIVTTVDNLPREEAPVNRWPVHPVGSWLKTEKQDGVILLAPSNTQRYAGYIQFTKLIDAKLLAGLYQRFYPLFQQAYVELGYPHGYFNDRLIVAIDHLLASPEPAEPIQLLSSKVFFDFADPALQQRSAGQKIMLRIGVENARIVKAKLREFRQAVAGPGIAK